MCIGGSPDIPDPVPAEEPPAPVTSTAVAADAAREAQKKKAAASIGKESTLMTGALGLDTKATTATTKLLGG